jgi:hypothetical protein
MESVGSTLNSPRFQRYMLWVGVVVFIVGAAVLTFTLVGGSDTATNSAPDKGFHPKLPAKSVPLRNADGVTVKTFTQLDPTIRQDIKTFIATAVARKHLGDSWTVVAPSLRAGYTKKSWAKGDALPVVPYPGVDAEHVEYFLRLDEGDPHRGRARRKAGRQHTAGHLPARARARRHVEEPSLAHRLLDAALDAASPAELARN